VALVVAAVFLVHETRGTTFWVDEWSWALERRGWDVDTFLRPHNEHLSLLPLLIYKVLFTTVGLDHYGAFRALVIAGHLGCVTLVFAYASRRVGSLAALGLATVMLFLGPAWQNIVSPFQVTWLISLGAGVAALLALDRRDRTGDVLACVCLAVSLASSGLGLAIAIGVLLELALTRRGWRDLWIVAIPGLPYALWWVTYQDAQFVQGNIDQTPHFAVESFAGALSALTGLAGSGIPDGIDPLAWGRPLAVLALIALAWGLARQRPVAPRVMGLLVMVLAFWLLTGLRRAMISPPDASRYLYVGALFIVLIAVELARGLRLSRAATLVLGVAVAAIVLTNAGTLRDAGRFLRTQADAARADLAALEAVRGRVGPRYVAASFPGTPFVVIRAGQYYSAADDYGSPAYSPSELANAPEPARVTADAELIRADRVRLEPGGAGEPGSRPPTVLPGARGELSERAGCLAFRPSPVRAHDAAPLFEVTVPPSGLVVRNGSSAARVDVRRFAAGYSRMDPDTVVPRAAAVLRIQPDRLRRPWHARVAAQGRVSVCGLR
jgi:hypothetical protein